MAAAGCKEGGRERDGRLGLGMRQLLQVARREGERVLGLGEKRDLYNKTRVLGLGEKRDLYNKTKTM
jgi:hypothetical protein